MFLATKLAAGLPARSWSVRAAHPGHDRPRDAVAFPANCLDSRCISPALQAAAKHRTIRLAFACAALLL